MGCKQSELRDGGAQGNSQGNVANPPHLPPVPEESWYAQPFVEESSMYVTPYHKARRGAIVFSNVHIPLTRVELEGLPNKEPSTTSEVELGKESVYGMAYLHETALCIEHHWRTRVSHDPPSGRYERPFYNMLLGVRVFINDIQVPDCFPHKDSLTQCTSTYLHHQAVAQWRAVPTPLLPDVDSLLLTDCSVYVPLVYSFLQAAITLEDGRHVVRVELVYGCRAENDFCTLHIAKGSFVAVVTPQGREEMLKRNAIVGSLLQENPPHMQPLAAPSGERCVYCGEPLAFLCTQCTAKVCGTARCVWSPVVGYPCACTSHQCML